MAATASDDERFMAAALALAARPLGTVWPNPAVGCVLVRPDGPSGVPVVVGRGWTQPGGRPHGETEALARAGAAARGATAYISLEPCSHHGQTPPCADALAAAGIGRAVVALIDPDPRVNGGGLARLRAAGIPVTLGVGAEAAATLNEGFLRRIGEGRPMVTLKLATTLDGRIATHGGESRWITGEAARAAAHRLRASHDAVMVGSTTALLDDPLLDCRLPGLEQRRPVRIVMDGRLRLPLTSRLVASVREQPTWVVTLAHGDRARVRAFRDCGIELIEIDDRPGEVIDPDRALRALAERGLTRILVEGGSHLAAALLRADRVDRVEWFRAASVIGGDGIPAVQAFGIDRLDRRARFSQVGVQAVGADLWERYRRTEPLRLPGATAA